MVSTWKSRIVAGLVALALFIGAMAMMSPDQQPQLAANAEEPARQPGPRVNTGHSPGDAFFIDLSMGHDPKSQYLSDFDMDAGWIETAFRDENVVFDGKGMWLMVQRDRTTKVPYTSAEFQHMGFSGFGRYEVVMRSSAEEGVVSSFFTYTGEYNDSDPHDEIDFEWVGKSPRQVHLNYFRKGDSDPADINLWFDASEGLHLYAFEWLPDSITWYVDGKEVRKVEVNTSKFAIPTASGKVVANIWSGTKSAVQWAGESTFHKTSAFYTCMSHVPVGKAGRQCSDVFTPPSRPQN